MVSDNGKLQIRLRDLVDVLDPFVVAFQIIRAQPDHLDASFFELATQLCKGAQLGRAHGRKVCWVAEQDRPGIVDELVEVDVAVGGFCLEVWGH